MVVDVSLPLQYYGWNRANAATHCHLGPLQFPPELWGRVSVLLQPREFLNVSACSPNLLLPREGQDRWRHFCHAEGFARRAHGLAVAIRPLLEPASAVAGAAEPEGFATPSSLAVVEVDWWEVFRLNARAQARVRKGHYVAFACVRVGDEEIRVPEDDGGLAPPMAEVAAPCGLDPRLRPVATLETSLSRLLHSEAEDMMPFRLRDLVDGRPTRFATFHFCHMGPADVLVEWPLGRSEDGDWLWSYPPFGGCGKAPERLTIRYPGPHPTGRGNGWLVELCAAAPSVGCNEAAGSSGNGREDEPMHTRWVLVGAHKTAEDLTLQELLEEVAGYLPSFGFRASKVCPADARYFVGPSHEALPRCGDAKSEAYFDGLLLRDLRWTQGERLYMTEVNVLAPDDLQDGGCFDAHGALPHETVVLFERDAVRPRRNDRRRCGNVDGHLRQASALEGLDVQSLVDSNSPASGRTCLRSSSCQQMWDGHDPDELPLDAEVPHSCRVLLSSIGVRQFEFHPAFPDVMLVGRKDGVVAILDCEEDIELHALDVDSHPILGLSWLQTRPQWAVVGVAQSGTICAVRFDDTRPGSLTHFQVEPFPHLSSLSINCTDDFFMTSGSCTDAALYDMVTGCRMNTFRGLHHDFINILRFANRSPHLFATASFDHTCKVWDLRRPVQDKRPVAVLNTDTLNVMCCFSPDDQHVLTSGVDHALQQFSLSRNQDSRGSRFPLPSLHSDTNYRRSLYFAGGAMVATAATNESILRLYNTEEPHKHRGLISFRHMLAGTGQPSPKHFEDSALSFGSWSSSGQASEPFHATEQSLEEYVQSFRCHPRDPLVLGALLSTCDPHPESCIAMVHLEEDRK